ASAVGFSSGIVFSGWIDLDRNELDINGSVAPAYILSRLVRWIPILGTILTGTDKGGLIALDFRLTGSIDDPEKSSNPLSLAPGILRDVFRFEWLNYFRSDNSTKKED
ncbi:MAG: AsmA-like C-terminal domain-containing protein, partial [SAR324 cluster bacterium]|nr:AsmA-like C-terminal domain-containing protein [SAR324 cluster bacterium]